MLQGELMKRCVRNAFVIMLCAGIEAALASNAIAVAGDEQAIRKADQSLLQAVSKGDKKAVGALLDTDFSWTDSDGKSHTRAQVVKNLPTPAIRNESDAQVSERTYGQVGVVRVDRGKTHALRVWVKRKGGWRALVVHEVTQLENPAPAGSPGPGSDVCDNPCKGIPYKPKSAAERGVIASWQALETAVTAHDADAWAPHFLDEFALISSSGAEPSTKAVRMATIRKQKEAGAGTAPSPLVWARMFTFGDTVVMLSRHQPHSGKPQHVSRVWVKGKDMWQMAVSFQTRIVAAPAVAER
jgi:uncharacterized protein DUF4440